NSTTLTTIFSCSLDWSEGFVIDNFRTLMRGAAHAGAAVTKKTKQNRFMKCFVFKDCSRRRISWQWRCQGLSRAAHRQADLHDSCCGPSLRSLSCSGGSRQLLAGLLDPVA